MFLLAIQQRVKDPIDYPSSVPQVTGPNVTWLVTLHLCWMASNPIAMAHPMLGLARASGNRASGPLTAPVVASGPLTALDQHDGCVGILSNVRSKTSTSSTGTIKRRVYAGPPPSSMFFHIFHWPHLPCLSHLHLFGKTCRLGLWPSTEATGAWQTAERGDPTPTVPFERIGVHWVEEADSPHIDVVRLEYVGIGVKKSY